MKTNLNKGLTIFVLTAFAICQNPHALVLAQDSDAAQEAQENKDVQSISLVIGDVQPIETKNLTRVAVTNPEIVDISDAKTDKVFVVGKKPGQTEIFVWDDAGKRNITVRVATENLSVLKQRVQEVLEKAQIKGVNIDENPYEGKVVLSGSIPKQDKDALEKIMDPLSDRIINLVKIEVNEDLVQIDIQVTELSTTLVKQIGLDWNSSLTGSSSSSSGSSRSSSNNASSLTGNGLNLNYQESKLPPAGGKVFNISSFGRTTPINVAVNALVQEGKGRILSKPRLVVVSGKEASFLVGGEVPIRTTTSNSSGGSSQENVTFKQYGVNMTITPTIRQGKIDILLNVQISDIDKSNTDPQGDVGFITRSAQTQLFLDDKQNIVLAGLIKHTDGETVRGLPWLSKIPIAGSLFKTRNNGNPDADTELVISLTPTILKTKKMATEQVSFPSKRAESLQKEIEGSFEKEPLGPAPAVKAQNVAAPVSAQKTVEQAPTTAVAKPVPMMQNSEQAISDYVRTVQLKISKAITFPYEALTQKWEGTVKLRLRILQDGTLADCDLLQSSGHDVFDKDAQNTAKIVAPFSGFPTNMHQQDVVVTIPIIYSQNSGSNDTQTTVAAY